MYHCLCQVPTALLDGSNHVPAQGIFCSVVKTLYYIDSIVQLLWLPQFRKHIPSMNLFTPTLLSPES